MSVFWARYRHGRLSVRAGKRAKEFGKPPLLLLLVSPILVFGAHDRRSKGTTIISTKSATGVLTISLLKTQSDYHSAVLTG